MVFLWWGVFWVYVGLIWGWLVYDFYIMFFRVYVFCGREKQRSRKANKQREAEKRRNRKAEKQKSREAGKTKKQRSRKSGKEWTKYER